jgi:hypothetical protein
MFQSSDALAIAARLSVSRNALGLPAQWRAHSRPRGCMPRWRQHRAFRFARGPRPINASHFGLPGFGCRARVQRLALQKPGALPTSPWPRAAAGFGERARTWRGINGGVCQFGPRCLVGARGRTRSHAEFAACPGGYTEHSRFARGRVHAMQVASFSPNLGWHARAYHYAPERLSGPVCEGARN